MFLSVELQGDQILKRQLFRGADAAGNMRPALWAVREDMFRVIRMTFQSQGRRGGGSWKALDPATVAAKERRGLDPRILFGRHRLVNSFTQRGNVNMRSSITRHDIRLRSTLPYADVHQYGDEDRGIPARPFIRFLPTDRQRWVKMCETYLIGAMRV
jgi:phage gpG-like protein